jgi:hypothetical protein
MTIARGCQVRPRDPVGIYENYWEIILLYNDLFNNILVGGLASFWSANSKQIANGTYIVRASGVSTNGVPRR